MTSIENNVASFAKKVIGLKMFFMLKHESKIVLTLADDQCLTQP